MSNQNIQEIIDNDNCWDTGELGRDEAYVQVADVSGEMQKSIDEAVGLQMISIRLPKELIEDFKYLGEIHGLKYQALMRQILSRFAESEMKAIARKGASVT